MRLRHSLLPLLVLTAGTAHAFQATPNAPAPTGPTAPAAGAQTGPTQRPDRFGSITEIKGDVYTLESRRGTVTVTIPSTLSVQGIRGAAASRSDLKVGTRIGVYGEEKGGSFVASRVILMPARGAGAGTGPAPVTRPVTPVTPVVPAHRPVYPEITVDTTGAPDMAGFAARAKAICEVYYSQISNYLKSDGFTAPRTFKLVFREMDGVAYTAGDEIHFSAKFFREHPDDYGAAVHEMTHVIQHYRGNNPGWLVEALDDYVRFYRYEPSINVPHADPSRVGDQPEAYRVGAQFLDWTQTRYDKDLVPQLNAAMRGGTYSDAIWKDKTGRTLTELWADWKASLKAATSGSSTVANAAPTGK